MPHHPPVAYLCLVRLVKKSKSELSDWESPTENSIAGNFGSGAGPVEANIVRERLIQ